MWRVFEFDVFGEKIHFISEKPLTEKQADEVLKKWGTKTKSFGYLSTNKKDVADLLLNQLKNGVEFLQLMCGNTNE